MWNVGQEDFERDRRDVDEREGEDDVGEEENVWILCAPLVVGWLRLLWFWLGLKI